MAALDPRRMLQLALGALWLLDGMLQFQPAMFGKGFPQMPAGGAPGNPALVARPISWSAAFIGHHVIVLNAIFAAIQLLLGLGIAWRPTVRLALAGSVLWSLAGPVASYRRSGSERRQQLKWLMSGAAVCMVCGILTLVLSSSHGISQAVDQAATVGLGALPASIGVAVLKYRLFDIDRLISRTLAYAIVTGLLVGVYAGLVLLATQVLRFHDSVAVAASTLVAAALFSSLRRRVQRVVDRRFNRARYDAELTAAAFAARLMDSVDPDAVRADLASVVQRTLEPAHVSIWIDQHR